ncbi:GFA family protein [Paracoccus ravus]|uniref:GFA family protein n=1 Tax=Paracoccus ravus TaxID=2447760 RepID=UPI00106E8086|nr:GFA family protein [Paracoccus ravus]
MTRYHGSCFCGAVRFEAECDLSQGTSRCNCRFCRKMRYWEIRLPDPASFRLVAGRDHLAETPRSQDDGLDMHHWFCATCGTRLWTEGNLSEIGGHFVMVCINALDDASEAELIAAPVHHADGARDAWADPAPETRHL